jgi:transglutaminase-like putative cysteine protease
MRRYVGALAAAVLAVPAVAEITPLFVIPTTSEARAPIAEGVPIRVRLEFVDAEVFARILGVELAPGATNAEILLGSYPQRESQSDRTWREATFIVDFDEPAFAPLREEIRGLGERPAPRALVEFVNRIVDERVPRRWDFASIVAKRREGDCSEHAMLLAALLRMTGQPARVALGLAIQSDGTKFGAFGHAWVETQQDGKWVVADAALYGVSNVRYLPLGLIEDEGPGFALGIVEMTQAWTKQVTVLGPG